MPAYPSARVLAAMFAALLANSACLAAFPAPTLWYYAQVVIHPVLGLALAAAGARRLTRTAIRSPLGSVATIALGAGLALGIAVLVLGATRPYRPILFAHIGASVAGSILLVAYVRQTLSRRGSAASRMLGASLAVIVLVAAAVTAARAGRDEARSREYRIENPDVVPARMEEEGRGAESPFFPSSADTNVRGFVPADFFLTSESCGRCHKEIYDEWNASAHHFSSFNNQWYRKSIEYMQDVVGTQPSKWCAGCHDHAVFFNGRFDRPIREQIDTPEAQAGLSCTSCHSITRVNSTMGQGDFEIEYPPLHDLAVSDNPLLRGLHDKLTELAPAPHREVFLKPFHREQTPEFCSACHKVHLDRPVNHYRWFRGFNDYDNWQASGVSGEGARSFYYPPRPQTCADCHMPLVESTDPSARDGRVRSHRFAAANTALPFVNRDAAQLEAVQRFLQDGQVGIDVFGIARTGPPSGAAAVRMQERDQPTASTFAVGEESLTFGADRAIIAPPVEVLGPLGATPVSARRGESVRLEVVVRTRRVGHFFPAGTVDAFDVWVELEAVDDRGRVVLHSGAREGGSGPVDPGAHVYRSLLLDERGHPINKRNAWAARSVAYVRLIPPGAADTIHYRLDIPPDAGDRIVVTARLNYRKFAWWTTQWAFAGVRDPSDQAYSLEPGHDAGRWVFTGDTSRVSGQVKAIPDLPVTVMAVSEATLAVLPAGADLPDERPFLDRSVRERWNDYGIGLLLQGDIKGAEAVFLKVTEMDPDYADGWVNVGRARIQEGNLAGAEQVLRRALAVDPGLAKTHFFLGTVLKSLGRYDEAVGHLEHASAQYPRDRVVLNQLGRVRFLKRQYGEAVVEFRKVLKIDPEDLQAHYNLMLAYQGLGDSPAAGRERVLYERFKADESSQAITGDYRRLNPYDNNERQPVHEHGSVSRP